MPNQRWLDGTLLGYPGKKFRIYPVDGNPSAFLLMMQAEDPVSPSTNLDAKELNPSELLFRTLEKVTGYPQNHLKPEFDFEIDLGIDAMKRKRMVQHLAEALQLTSLQQDTLHTSTRLGDWLKLLQPQHGVKEIPVETSSFPQSKEEITELLLQIVQEKTGYSRDHLNLDADLEADLGIDTIKQAQIAGQIRRLHPISFQQGVRIKDFPTLRHWIQFVTDQSQDKRPNPIRYEYSTRRFKNYFQELTLPEMIQIDEAPKKIVILADRFGLAQSLHHVFQEQGIDSVISSLNSEDFAKIQQSDSSIILDLSAFRIQDDTPENHLPVLFGLLKLAQSAPPTLSRWISVLGQPDSFELGIDGAIAGWTRTLAQERPQLQTQILAFSRDDVQNNPNSIAQLILNRILDSSTPPLELHCSLGVWKTPILKETPVNLIHSPRFDLTSQSVILITGGTGGLGLEIAKDLAHLNRPILILIGRSTELSPTCSHQIHEIQELGSSVHYRSCDVTDPLSMHELTSWIQNQFGRLTGIIHAAGILEDRSIEFKTEDSFRKVYWVKTQGLKLLSDLAAELHPQFFSVFSSISGRLGNGGQSDYSAANSALSSWMTPLRKRLPQTHCFSVEWGAWDQVGMAAQSGISEILNSAGEGSISLDQGKSAFRNELFFGEGSSEVILRAVRRTDVTQTLPSLTEVALKNYYFLDEIHEYRLGNSLIAMKVFQLEKETWLLDHEILGVPILPATFGIEIMAQAALVIFPDFYIQGIHHFKIHQAIRISKDKGTPIRIQSNAAAAESAQARRVQVRLEILVQETFELAFEGTIDLRTEPLAIVEATASPSDSDPYSKIYQKEPGQGIPLGPSFHVLTQFEQEGSQVSSGTVLPKQPFHSHFYSGPYSREAGFHAAALMRMKQNQEILIPKAIGKIVNHRQLSHESGLSVKAIYKEPLTFDLFIYDMENQLCTEIIDFKTLDIRELSQDWSHHESESNSF